MAMNSSNGEGRSEQNKCEIIVFEPVKRILNGW